VITLYNVPSFSFFCPIIIGKEWWKNYFFNKKTKSDLNIAVHAVNGRGVIDYEPKIL